MPCSAHWCRRYTWPPRSKVAPAAGFRHLGQSVRVGFNRWSPGPLSWNFRGGLRRRRNHCGLRPGTAPQGEERGQHQRRHLVAGQPEIDPRLGTDEFRGEPKDEVGHEIDANQLPAEHLPSLKLNKHDCRQQMEGRFVELCRMPQLAVAEIHAPGQRSGSAVTAAGVKASQPSDADARCQRSGQHIAGQALDAQRHSVTIAPK